MAKIWRSGTAIVLLENKPDYSYFLKRHQPPSVTFPESRFAPDTRPVFASLMPSCGTLTTQIGLAAYFASFSNRNAETLPQRGDDRAPYTVARML
ncbi:hypothetical protein [Mesorhizobium sp.]|uniref:hypothetical protein n=1 Tax=Mesorhizobium sp. TaxID=1871066 RepID=UPI00257C14EE|nr:hypothetical protein [Mesorhizobium sp.]